MNSNSKIVIVKMREIIYTLLLLFLVALLIVCLVLMFTPKSGKDTQTGTGQSSGQNGAAAQNQTSTPGGTSAQDPTSTQNDTAAQSQTSTQSGSGTSAQDPTSTRNDTATQNQTSTPGGTSAQDPASTQSDTVAQSQTSTQSQSTVSTQAVSAASYTPGVYTTPLTLGNSTVDVEVTVDAAHINSIRLVNLSEATAAAFPLVSPALEHIADQILETQKLENITCPQENKYTSQLLLSAISDALARAEMTD